jgi:tetratricopeptide (TPR) repeat protein
VYNKDRRNQKTIEESHSEYRYERMNELLLEVNKLNPTEAVAILRNKDGMNDKSIGYGNEKAINQLLAHHSIVFKPEELKVWVSSNPYQLGEFVAYDLKAAFANRDTNPSEVSVSSAELNIAEDPFIDTESYQNYEAYRILERRIQKAINEKQLVAQNDLNSLIADNPKYWKAYYLVGKYQFENKQYLEALKNFKMATTKEITTKPDEEAIAKYIRKSKRKTQ